MSRSVLVTGASGFIGRAVLPLLAEASFTVHAVHRRGPAPHGPRVVAHRVDLLDAAETEALVARVRPSHLLHLAWYTTPGRYLEAAENVRWVDASLCLLRAFANTGGRHAVLVGSAAERLPTTRYGAAKRDLREQAAAAAARAGVRLAWARLFAIYGPYEPPERLVPTVVRSLLAARPVELSDGRRHRDVLFVADAASALAGLLTVRADGAFDVGSGELVSIRAMVEAIARRAGRPELLRFGARADDGVPELGVADPTRLREAAGWAPDVVLDEGIDRTIAWWRGQTTVMSGARTMKRPPHSRM